MIDTNIKNQQLPTELQLNNLDINQVEQVNFDNLKDEFITLQKHGTSYLVEFHVGLDSTNNIRIQENLEKEDSHTRLFGIKEVHYRPLVAKNEQNIDEIVKKLMTNYISWLKRQYKNQTNINDADLYKLMHRNHQTVLFTDSSYTNYLIANLNHINGNLITMFKVHVRDIALKKQFMDNVLFKLSDIHTIKSSTINAIVDLISCDNLIHQNQTTNNAIMTILYDIIVHNNSNQLTIIFDTPIEYIDLIHELPKQITNHLELPISAIPNLIDELVTMKNMPINTSFILVNKNDLQLLVNELLKLPDNKAIDLLFYTKSLCIKLTTQDVKIIQEMIEVINNMFTNTEKLQQIARVLAKIIKQKS